ncbi:Serine/threonine-protein kinase ATG1 [Zancudomyces culisetae]|uniref:non-specific serine/threonine protein kinase n=1 Tax=Zancudomyces culisetae TaxID=1213189 RepID=A0A1R1PGJ4_ZANCU|nr:Serine/threonine-protein kinase ATG1 [Zancudomyces culisetae]|eukprot:OMH80115.1 Serine/threonine-protein kinase ATG1 [Zancudomyces culisetae]
MTSSLADTLCGSPLYMAPEILRYEKYDARADLWSVGAVIYEMLTGKPPFRASNHVELQHKIDRANDVIFFPGNDSDGVIDIKVKDLVQRLLKRKPDDRIAFKDFFEHPGLGLKPENDSEEYSEKSDIDDVIEKIENVKIVSKEKPAPRNENQGLDERKKERNRVLGQQYVRAISTRIGGGGSNTRHDEPAEYSAGQTGMGTQPKRAVTNTEGVPETRQARADNFEPTNKVMSSAEEGTVDSSALVNISEWSGRTGIKKSEQALAEKEYVVVEKRAVEVNVLADEFASSTPPVKGYIGAAVASAASRPTHTAPAAMYSYGGIRNNMLQQMTALTQISTNKAPGTPSDTPGSRNVGSSGRLNQSANSNSENAEQSEESQKPEDRLLQVRKDKFTYLDGALYSTFSYKPTSAAEGSTIRQMESLCYKAFAVSWLANVKLGQLLSVERGSGGGGGSKAKDLERSVKFDRIEFEQQLDLLHSMDVGLEITIGEGFALYLKAISLLHKAATCAKDYWDGEIDLGPHVSGGRRVSGTYNPAFTLSIPFNNAVQWVRNHFNECMDKADVMKAACSDGELDFQHISAEKILYEKALELSRGAAVNELHNNLVPMKCEKAYQLSIWLLSAIIEETDQNTISSDDRNTVDNFILHIIKRLESLRAKT